MSKKNLKLSDLKFGVYWEKGTLKHNLLTSLTFSKVTLKA